MFKRRFWNETEKDKKDAEDDSSSSDDEAADGLDQAGSEEEGSSEEEDSQASGTSFCADRCARRGRIDRERCSTAPEGSFAHSRRRGAARGKSGLQTTRATTTSRRARWHVTYASYGSVRRRVRKLGRLGKW